MLKIVGAETGGGVSPRGGGSVKRPVQDFWRVKTKGVTIVTLFVTKLFDSVTICVTIVTKWLDRSVTKLRR